MRAKQKQTQPKRGNVAARRLIRNTLFPTYDMFRPCRPPPPSCGCPAGIRRRAWQQQHLPTRRETPLDCRAPRGAVANVGLSCVRETSRPCARLVCATESVPRHFERRGLQRRAEGNMTILTSQSLFTGENVYYVAGWRLGWSARLNGILAFDPPARGLA